jgi:hypothetical protein
MDATNVLLIEHLPKSVNIQSITTSGGSCTQSAIILNQTRLSCALSLLPQGQSWTVTLTVATSATSAKTAARITFQGRDPVPANNYYLVTMQHTASSGGGSAQSPPPARPAVNSIIRNRPVGGRRLPDQ